MSLAVDKKDNSFSAAEETFVGGGDKLWSR